MSDNVLVMKISTDSDSEVKVHVSLRSPDALRHGEKVKICWYSRQMLRFMQLPIIINAKNQSGIKKTQGLNLELC